MHIGFRCPRCRKNNFNNQSIGKSESFKPQFEGPRFLYSQGNERVGFEVVTVNGQRGTLASINNPSPESARWPTVGRYRVDIASFDNVALPELQIKEDTDLFVIDEVGKMELYSSSFFPAVLNLLNSNIPLLATIPIARHGRDIPGVARLRNHPGAIIYTLDPNNRDTYRERVYSHLVDLFAKN
ncbi:cancer-related nucleoside-triphosphatase-like isoform X2 [Chenopodium quinoa]|uniref:cancer-related nucleoside-triphosphatase-like isoform X2 n=1 Tax=Chenopodium quinoa TaxID=63459 RepID=UPI000B76C087|nr:cancer-related nucleoside-triphosphatase-like isoform X2 [Chenopodium quinoa]